MIRNKKKRKSSEEIFEAIMTQKFHKLMKDTKPQI